LLILLVPSAIFFIRTLNQFFVLRHLINFIVFVLIDSSLSYFLYFAIASIFKFITSKLFELLFELGELTCSFIV